MADPTSTDMGFFYNPLKQDTLLEGRFDPFIGTERQASRFRAHCNVFVDGVNITDRLLPHLISVQIIDGDQQKLAEIEIDDRDGKLPIPPWGAPVVVEIGWRSESFVRVFDGIIQNFEHGFGRKQGGRRMWVHASTANLLGSKLKEPVQDSMGEGAPPGKKQGPQFSLSSWIQQSMKHAGIDAQINGAFSGITQDFWSASGVSPMHLVNTLKEQFGFVHQFDKPGHLTVELPSQRGVSCLAVWRDNLIGWRVVPFAARSTFAGSKQQNYDTFASGWKQMQQTFGLKGPWGDAIANIASQIPASTEGEAAQNNQGAQTSAEGSMFGNGKVLINGEPNATWNSDVEIIGARPGVDGRYRIKQAIHSYSRKGYTTELEVEPRLGEGSSASMDRQSVWLDLPKPNPNVGGQ